MRIQTRTQQQFNRPVPVSSNFRTGTTLVPSRAIVIYESSIQGDALATVHRVGKGDNGRPELSPGELLSAETLVNLLQTVKTETAQIRQILSAHVLWRDAAMMVWYRPPQRKPIYFATTDTSFNRALNGKEVAHPSLLFKATPGRLAIFALASDTSEIERPSNETALCFAPYFNLYGAGDMCRGNSPYPKSLKISTIEHWEKAFFDTLFTHSNYHAPFLQHAGGHNGLWREMLQAPHFPSAYLKKNGLTLGGILNDEKI